MSEAQGNNCIGFSGPNRIGLGSLTDVAVAAKTVLDNERTASVLIFDAVTSHLVEVDFRGTPEDVVRRIEARDAALAAALPTVDAVAESPRGRGRPNLGVVPREVTLLPRHWDWLNTQPGGASVALRKLVEEARRVNAGRDRLRQSQDSTYRFMSAMAGDLPGFEEAARALFAGRRERLEAAAATWPPDIRDHTLALATVDD